MEGYLDCVSADRGSAFSFAQRTRFAESAGAAVAVRSWSCWRWRGRDRIVARTRIHAAGEYTHACGKTKRVAVSVGPEHGTVGPQQVKEAAKEAVQGVGYDVLVVCGFAFATPHISEEVKRYGKLAVLATRMNPDLAMGDELLKKTGAGNLFMLFGEPDVGIRKAKDGKSSRSNPATERARLTARRMFRSCTRTGA